MHINYSQIMSPRPPLPRKVRGSWPPSSYGSAAPVSISVCEVPIQVTARATRITRHHICFLQTTGWLSARRSHPWLSERTSHEPAYWPVDSTPRSSSHRKHHGISNPFDQCNINSLVVVSLPCNKRASMHTGWSIVVNNLRPVWALCHSGRACTDAHAQRRSLHTSSTDRMDTNCSVARIRVSLAISSTPLQLLQLARF